MEDGDLHLARLRIDDLNGLALSWRIRALQGDEATVAISEALMSVARRRCAAAVARVRILRAYLAWAPLRKLAEALMRR
ncbi:hypothetical protein J7E62_30890 [Variovorax paradoxus]|nr:hypothetical protein [Variovorax paradoxus]